tara:strand:- start:205 stop:642 length:438 start_codon:yes stop_codon:yes gene_type:complete
MSTQETTPKEPTTALLKQRRSRRQVLASLGFGAAALYVAPTLLSMGQAEAHDRGHSRPNGHHHQRPGRGRAKHSHSRPSYSRPHYARPDYSRPDYSRPEYSRNGYSSSPYPHHGESRPYRYDERPRWERDGVIELRISRLLPHRW